MAALVGACETTLAAFLALSCGFVDEIGVDALAKSIYGYGLVSTEGT